MQRLKQLEDENRRLKQIVAEQTLDIQALKAVVAKSGRPHCSAHGGGVADRRAARQSSTGVPTPRVEHGSPSGWRNDASPQCFRTANRWMPSSIRAARTNSSNPCAGHVRAESGGSSMSGWHLTVLTPLLLAFQTASPLDRQWTRVRTSAFEAIGDVEQSRIVAAAIFFERLLEATRLVIPSLKGPAPSPIMVVVTEDSSLTSEGFVEGRYQSYAIVDTRRSNVHPATVSSVVRQLVRNSAESTPLWVEVGLGEFFTTADFGSPGSGITFGQPVAAHLVALRRGMLPMPVLLSTTTESAYLEDPTERRLFVAQSWLLVHYLCAGDMVRRQQLGSYVKELVAGTPPELALKLAMAVNHETLGYKLLDYVERAVYPVRSERSAYPESSALWEARSLAAGDAAALIGDVLMQAGKVSQALEPLRRLPPEEARRANALGIRGRVSAANGDRGEALRLFSESVRDPAADDLWRYHYAAALLGATSLLESNQIAVENARLAQELLVGVHERQPERADVLALLGLAHLVLQNPGAAIQLMTDAFRSCPRHEYALLRARAHIAAGDTGGAQRLLVPLVERGRSQRIRQAAGQLLEGLPRTLTAPAEAIPVYREPRNDELKASGYLAEISCSPSWTVVHVTLDDRMLRLAAASLRWVDFISYRRDLPAAVPCGIRQSPERVWVIYRPDKSAPEGTEGFVRSVEFAPVSRDK